MKFQVGDRVKVRVKCDINEEDVGVCPRGVSISNGCKGKIGVVKHIDYMNYIRYKVEFSSEPRDYCYFCDDDLKLADWSVS